MIYMTKYLVCVKFNSFKRLSEMAALEKFGYQTVDKLNHCNGQRVNK